MQISEEDIFLPPVAGIAVWTVSTSATRFGKPVQAAVRSGKVEKRKTCPED